MRRRAPVVCSIGSLDPTGAAGLSADLLVYSRLGAQGVAVAAGLTAQNSRRVAAVLAVAPRQIEAQLASIWEQVTPDGICVGLVPGATAIGCVGRFLRRLKHRPPVVIDPVVASSSGTRFLGARSLAALRDLLPLATIVTPNLEEAAALSGLRVRTAADAQAAAVRLSALGCAVLVTGGHGRGATCVDVLAQRRRVRRYAGSRLSGSLRGSGGVLAAAIAVSLARGEPLDGAIRRGRREVRMAFGRARRIGSGAPQYVVR